MCGFGDGCGDSRGETVAVTGIGRRLLASVGLVEGGSGGSAPGFLLATFANATRSKQTTKCLINCSEWANATDHGAATSDSQLLKDATSPLQCIGMVIRRPQGASTNQYSQ
tara:strand:- start:323 stop:655 length:333 start_codon:yes stop_codon:yes gene_type:complete